MINTQQISEISAIPTVSSGNLLSGKEFELNLNVRKYYGDCTKKTNYLWRSSGSGALIETNPDIKFRSFSPDGFVLLIGRNSGDKDRFIEIWKSRGNCFIGCFKVSNIHGDFCIDEVFSSFSWSPDGNKFVYVAERKDSSREENEPEYSKFVENENFGERLQNVKEPVICYFDVLTLKSEVINIKYNNNDAGRVDKIYPAQPVFIDDESIAYMGIDVGSKKLGMVYIYCRPTSIYKLNISEKVAIRLSSSDFSSRSPIVSSDGSRIAYLRNSLGRSHFKTSQLVIFDLTKECEKVIVDIVKDPKTDFPGLYCQRIPIQRFNDKIYLNTCWFDLRPVESVNINDGKVKKIIENFNGSSRILDIKEENILIVNSTSTCPGRISIYNIKTEQVKIFDIDPIINNSKYQEIEKDLESSVLELNSKVHIVLLKPKGFDKIPLIIVPHGGPNSVYSVDYVLYPTILAKMGYAVASINYTGSIGFGDSSIDALEGQIGERDVEDCYLALQLLLKKSEFTADKVIVMGGSHGGYLTAHLSAKYPDTFVGAILRNPVIDLPSMTVTSDISDWTFGQLGIDFDQLKARGISAEELKLFHDRSPSTYAKQVKCPTLVMLGAMDLRVPPSQGRYWVNLLKGNGVVCELFLFPDANHGLETADSERFGLEAILNFLNRIGL